MINLRMATDIKKRRLFKRDQDLFDFARAYLSEAFPNPERKGCPPDEKLRDLAVRPTESNVRITDHLTCCSPCFKAYMAHLSLVRVEAADSSRIRLIKLNRRSLRLGAAVIAIVWPLPCTHLSGELTMRPQWPRSRVLLLDPVPRANCLQVQYTFRWFSISLMFHRNGEGIKICLRPK
jgi:hypothetical protein